MLSMLLVIGVFGGAEAFGKYTEMLTLHEDEWCLSPLDEEMYFHYDCSVTDCDKFNAETCWEACEKSGLTFTNVDFNYENAACYCQNDCLCMVDDGGATMASEEMMDLPPACCDVDEYKYAYHFCVGRIFATSLACTNGDLTSCVDYDIYDTIDELCYEEDGQVFAYICNDDLSMSSGPATSCDATTLTTVDETIPFGWGLSVVVGCDDRRRRLGEKMPFPKKKGAKKHHPSHKKKVT